MTELANSYASYARAVAYKTWRKRFWGFDLEEFTSAAYLGLSQAAAHWDSYCAEHGYSPEDTQYFKAYAVKRINGAILDYLREQDPTSRLQRDRLTPAELLRLRQPALSLNFMAESEEGYTYEPEPEWAHAKPTTETDSEARYLLTYFVSVYRSLPLLQQQIIAYHYYQDLTMTEIAAILHISSVRASREHVVAVDTIHASLLKEAIQ